MSNSLGYPVNSNIHNLITEILQLFMNCLLSVTFPSHFSLLKTINMNTLMYSHHCYLLISATHFHLPPSYTYFTRVFANQLGIGSKKELWLSATINLKNYTLKLFLLVFSMKETHYSRLSLGQVLVIVAFESVFKSLIYDIHPTLIDGMDVTVKQLYNEYCSIVRHFSTHYKNFILNYWNKI